MARLFISYSHSDAQFVSDLVPLLNKVFPNHQVWYDEHISGGQDWWKRILREIQGGDLFIFLVSNDSLTSDYCQAEYREAFRLQKPCLPVIIRPRTVIAKAPDDMATHINSIQYINMAGGFKDYKANAALYSAIMELLAAIPAQPPMPLSPNPTNQPETTGKSKKVRAGGNLTLLAILVPVLIVIGVALIGILPSLLARNENPTQVPQTQTPIPSTPTSSATVALPTATMTPSPTQTIIVTVVTITPFAPVSQLFDGVEMVRVPAGCFMMGSADGQDEEKPVNKQCFDAPFWIDRYEVSQAQFKKFGGQAARGSHFQGDKRPVDSITWIDARDFCAKRGARLLTEAEWEYAARGPDNLVYPWGNYSVAENVVFSGNSHEQSAEVGSKPKGISWVGAYDMSGNIWEWVSSIFWPYPYDAKDGRENLDEAKSRRVLRGGAWDSFAGSGLRSAYRGADWPSTVSADYGFRCGRTS